MTGVLLKVMVSSTSSSYITSAWKSLRARERCFICFSSLYEANAMRLFVSLSILFFCLFYLFRLVVSHHNAMTCAECIRILLCSRKSICFYLMLKYSLYCSTKSRLLSFIRLAGVPAYIQKVSVDCFMNACAPTDVPSASVVI